MGLSLLFLTTFSIIVSGCTNTEKVFEPVVNTKLVNAKVPKSLRRCAAKPKSPVIPTGVDARTQKAVAILIAKLDHAHANCKANLAAVDKILTAQENRAKSFNKKPATK